MIIGYYEQAFFSGGTYYKLSKKDNENKYKIEYSYSVVPNYIPKAEKFIKKFETLRIEDDMCNEKFEGKIKSKYIDYNKDIEKLINYILECNWEKISKKEYIDDETDDGTNWQIYLKVNNAEYEIEGYEKTPIEVLKVVESLKNISNDYLEDIVQNKKDKEIIKKNKKSNILFMKYLKKRKIIKKEELKKFIDSY